MSDVNDWVTPPASDDWVTPAAPSISQPSRLDSLKSAVTDIPHKIYEAASSAGSTINDTLNPFSDARRGAVMKQANAPSFMSGLSQGASNLGDVGGGLMAVPALAASPITGAARSVIGHSWDAALPPLSPEDIAKRKAAGAPIPMSGDEVADTAMMGLSPARGGLSALKNPVAIPTPPTPNGPLGVTLSQGQATGELPLIRAEQAAKRGQLGPQAENIASEFGDQQTGQIQNAQERVTRGLDPYGQMIATNPQDAAALASDALKSSGSYKAKALDTEYQTLAAPLKNAVHPLDAADAVATELRNSSSAAQSATEGTQRGLQQQHEAIRSDLGNGEVLARNPQDAAEVVSNSITRSAEAAQESTDNAYARMRELPGSFDPAAFRGIANNIKKFLNTGDDPVVLNSKTTPMAVNAIQDVNKTLGDAARIALDPETKSHDLFTPGYVDNIRKRLVSFERQARSAARSTGDWSDVRAMGRVKDAFDDIVQNGLSKKFSGDGAEVASAFEEARGLHRSYRSAFTSQGSGDKVGPIIEQIIGRREGQAAPPNQISQWLYGNGQTPVLVARRLTSMFGEGSPEAASLKQGLFSYLTERPEGVTTWDNGKVSDRIFDFLNGRGRALSKIYLNPKDRTQLTNYANGLKSSVAEPTQANDVVSRVLDKISGIGGQPATANEVADILFGRSNVGSNPIGVKLAHHIKDAHGENSPAFASLRQGLMSKLLNADKGHLGFDPADSASKIRQFVTGQGRPMAETVLNPQQRSSLLDYAKRLEAYSDDTALPKNDVDRAIQRIQGTSTGQPATPTEIADFLYGRSGAGDRGISVRLAQRLKGEFGPSSPQWSGVKQGLFSRLIEPAENKLDWGPQKISERLHEFLNGSGKPLAETMFSPSEKQLISQYADLQKKLIVPPGGANRSETSTFVAPMFKKLGTVIATAVGAVIGHMAMPGMMGEAAGAVAGSQVSKVGERISNIRQAKVIARQMPIISQATQQYQRALAAAQKANSPLSQKTLSFAATNLSRALEPLGIKLESLWANSGTVNAPASQDQQQ